MELPPLSVFRARHRDDVIAGIDVVDLAGDAEVGQQIKRGAAEFVQRDAAAKRRMFCWNANMARASPMRNGQRTTGPRKSPFTEWRGSRNRRGSARKLRAPPSPRASRLWWASSGRAAESQRDHCAPVSGISSAARFASSVKEKQEISMVREKFSRVVSA